MKELGLLSPDYSHYLTLDDWEIPRKNVVLNRKLGEGAFGTVCGGEMFSEEEGWVAVAVKTLKIRHSMEEKVSGHKLSQAFGGGGGQFFSHLFRYSASCLQCFIETFFMHARNVHHLLNAFCYVG